MKTKYDIKRVLEFYRQCNEYFNIDDGLYPTATSEDIMNSVVEHLSTVDDDRVLTEFHIWEVSKLLGKKAMVDNDIIGGVDFSDSLDLLDNLSL
jgi:hypothetical protein